MNISKNLWLLPFLSFIGGYCIIRALYKTDYIQVPPLVGLSLQNACSVATKAQLTIRLVAEKEDADLAEGTVISQTPSAHARLKPHQSVLLTASKKPAHIRAPELQGISIEQARAITQEKNIRTKIYTLDTPYPPDQCIGQMPTPDSPLENGKMLIYASGHTEKKFIMPHYKNMPIAEVVASCASQPVKITVTHEFPQESSHTCASCIVIDQRPLAGSLVSLNADKPLIIHLQVAQNSRW